jgi:hypothetical protein
MMKNKTLLEINNEDLNKEQRYFMVMGQKINIVQISVLSKYD